MNTEDNAPVRYFLFGTLRHLPLLEAVLGGPAVTEPATLADHAVMRAAGHSFPILIRQPGARAEGLLVHTDADGAARLDLYEEGFDYKVTEVTVDTPAGPRTARLFASDDAPLRPDGPWDLDDWARRYAPATVEAVPEVLDLARTQPFAVQQARYPMVLARADSTLRARAHPAPATLRRSPAADDLQIDRLDRPYAQFFGVEEARMRFRRFDGSLSAPVRRAAFVMADAVTVLPYDAASDHVLLIEQHRFGPQVRGDPNPWSLEPIAGRIDPGETPETTAAREAMEEAGLTLQALHPIAQCYPTPGAVTEYLYLFLALADLDQPRPSINGLASEAEDIRNHHIPFAQLMALIDSGEVQNGPLLASAFWLALNRDRLRQQG